MATKFHESRLNHVEIENPGHFIAEQSYFNFQEDKIEFELRSHYATASKIKIQSTSVIYSITGRPSLNIPIMFQDHSERKNNNCIYKIHACFKDRLLDLFSPMNKAFKLFINYSTGKDQNYTITFFTPVPVLDKLEDYNPKKRFTGVFMPEDMNKPLIKLFTNRFYLKASFNEMEIDLHKDLAEFIESEPDERSQRDDFVDMLERMLTIEDMETMKQTSDYDLEFQKVVPFRECRYTLRQSVEKHLKYLMCDKKRNNFQRTAYVIEAQQKMPVDAMEFEYVYVSISKTFIFENNLIKFFLDH